MQGRAGLGAGARAAPAGLREGRACTGWCRALLGQLAHPGRRRCPPGARRRWPGPSRSSCSSSTAWVPSSCAERRPLAPMLLGGVGRLHHLGRPEHDGLRADHAGRRDGRRPSTAWSGTGWPRRRGHERPAVVGRRGRRPDARARARRFQPCPSFPGAPGPVPVVTRYDYGPTGFTAAHLGRRRPAPLAHAGRPRDRGPATRRGRSPFVYAYYEGIDKVAHAEGLGRVLRRRAARRRPAGGRRARRAAAGCGAGGDGRSRAGRRRRRRSRCSGPRSWTA